MIHYIVKITTKYKDKKGVERSMDSYLHKISKTFLGPIKQLSNMEDAKQFDCKSEANRIANRLFRKDRIEIIKIIS